MIKRRDLLSAAFFTTGIAVVSPVSASAWLNSTGPDRVGRPLLFVTDESMGFFGVSQDALAALNSGVTDRARRIVMPTEVIRSLPKSVAWLGVHRGATMICAMDAKRGFLFDEVLKERRARVLFRGEHHAMRPDQGPVRHDITELPATAGITDGLPSDGAWSAALGSALSLVAEQQWSPAPFSGAEKAAVFIHAAAADFSLLTYVIEI